MKLIAFISAAAALFLGGWAVAQTTDPAPHGMRGKMMGSADGAPGRMGSPSGSRGGPGMGMGMMGMGHGSATPEERADIHGLLFNHEQIRRTVTNLPNGIRTVTESDDPQVARMIKQHVADMAARLEEGRDPGLPIESPALRSLFPARAKIDSTYATTDAGYVVIQTSSEPAVARALQAHAAEVTDLAERGMAAAHEGMMKSRSVTTDHGTGPSQPGEHQH